MLLFSKIRFLDRPIQSKKAKHEETQKLKQIITKNVNKAVETEIRSRSTGDQRLSNTQKAVAEYNKKTLRKK